MKKYIAEFIGTAVLVIFGCGVAVATGVNIVATALAFGLVIVALAYVIGPISGCHVNPAVSFAMLLTRQLKPKEFCGYILSQFLGGIAGASILGLLLSSFKKLGSNGYGSNLINGNEVTLLIAILIEVILTFVFVYAILGVTSKKEYAAVSGIVIGLVLCLVHLLGLSFTGTSVNPARSFGPALLEGSDALKQVWVFIVAPLLGSALASFTFKHLNKTTK